MATRLHSCGFTFVKFIHLSAGVGPVQRPFHGGPMFAGFNPALPVVGHDAHSVFYTSRFIDAQVEAAALY